MKLKQKIRKNIISLGAWVQSGSEDVAEVLANFNKIDWVCIDAEHGNPNCRNSYSSLFKSIKLGGASPFIRSYSLESNEIKHYLDAGAEGIILPNVKKSKDLEVLFNNLSLPPKGSRGVGFYRANNYGLNFNNYFVKAKENTYVAMIENIVAINNLEEILKIKMIDAIFIGPYDLSASMGIPGDFKNKKFLDVINEIKNKSKIYNKSCGIHLIYPNKNELNSILKSGFRFIACSIDIQLMISSMEKLLND